MQNKCDNGALVNVHYREHLRLVLLLYYCISTEYLREIQLTLLMKRIFIDSLVILLHRCKKYERFHENDFQQSISEKVNFTLHDLRFDLINKIAKWQYISI